MSREVITAKDIINHQKSSDKIPSVNSIPATADGYFDRLFKYIPAELVAGYIFVTGVVKQLTDQREVLLLQWSLFAAFCLLTPLYLWKVQKVRKASQLGISLLSFTVWVFALGGPFATMQWYNPLYGYILLPVFTVIIAIWEAE
ncbi:MAG: hypothetical protein RBT38_01900 [Bacteroidales bacterium]|jgi:hypothetical protein|nr:hypothetical protein [Bacteroidales bacterium]